MFFQVDGHYFPGASILFIGKETPQYRAAWQYIMEKLPHFRPKRANADFEDAQNTAAEEETGLEIDNCQFHYATSIFRNMVSSSFFFAVKNSCLIFTTFLK